MVIRQYSLAIFLFGIAASSALVPRLRVDNEALHLVEDRIRSPDGPTRKRPGHPGGPGRPGGPVGPGGPGGLGGPLGPGLPQISMDNETCISMCEKLYNLVDMASNMTDAENGNIADMDIPPEMVFIFFACNSSTDSVPSDRFISRNSVISIQDSSKDNSKSEDSGESKIMDRLINWDQLRIKRQLSHDGFLDADACATYNRMMSFKPIGIIIDNVIVSDKTGNLEHIHNQCQRKIEKEMDDDSDDGDDIEEMIRIIGKKKPGGHGPPGGQGLPGPGKFCRFMGLLAEMMGTSPNLADIPDEVLALLVDMAACVCGIDLEQ